jgi:putative transport protein
VKGFLEANPLLVLFGVLAAGVLVGRVRVAGFSLGVAAVLFAGLAVSAYDPAIVLPEAVWQIGIAVLVYTIGLAAGPSFVPALRHRGLAANLVTLLAIAASAAVTVGAAAALGVAGPLAAGTYTGAVTSTPALAAVLELLGADTSPVVGYSVAYPVGVLCPLLAVWLVRRLARMRRVHHGLPAALPAHPRPVLRTLALPSEGTPAFTAVGSLRDRCADDGLAVAFARLRHGEETRVATDGLPLVAGDRISVVGLPVEIETVQTMLGARIVDEQLDLDRAQLDVRRIVISNADIVGRTLGEVDLGSRFGATATRLRRGDVEVVPSDETVLQPGDRLRVVAPVEEMPGIAQALGDSLRAISEVDVATFGLGIALGIALGTIPLPLPGLGTFTLGIAGGTLLVGLVLGALQRTGPLVWQLPHEANLTLRQFGLVLLLAGIGINAGGALKHAITSGQVGSVLVLGVCVTLTSVTVLLAAARLARLPLATTTGVLAACQTQPAVLAFAAERAERAQPGAETAVNLGYATAYPLALVAKLVAAQVLVTLLR